MIEEMIIELKIIRGAIYLKTLSRGLEEKYFIYDLSIPSNTMAAHIGNPKITSFEDSVFSGEYCAGEISKNFLENLEKSRAEVVRKP